VRFPFTVKLRVRDEDKKSADDTLGDAEFTVSAAGKGRVDGITLSTQGTVKVAFESTDIAPTEGFECESGEMEAIAKELAY
jgi:hypothetical protein